MQIWKLAAGVFCCAGAVMAHAEISQQISARVVQWAAQNSPRYRNYMALAKSNARAEVPIPPEVDPPCNACDDPDTKPESTSFVETWMKQAMEPESSAIQGLIQLDHELQNMGIPADKSSLTPSARTALSEFSVDDMEDSAVRLSSRLVGDKAIPMGEKYDTEPKRAYAGTQFLLAASRNQSMVQGLKKSPDRSHEGIILSLVARWFQSISDTMDREIVNGHAYNLCPVYVDIIREVQLAGGPSADLARLRAVLDKMDKLLTFQVRMQLHAEGHGDDGGKMNISWTLQSLLHLKVDQQRSCYTPEFINGGKTSVRVEFFQLETAKGDRVQLTSPREFEAELEAPKLSLCARNPVLQIPFKSSGFPPEQLTTHGYSSSGALLSSSLLAVATTNNMNTQKANAASGRSGTGPATADPHAESSDGQQQVEKMKAVLQAHAGDPQWLMSPEGQGVIAQMQSAATGMMRGRVASLNNAAANATSMSDMAAAFQSAQLPWHNGGAQPVSETLQVDHGSASFTLEVHVEQVP
jgi:hypothetical protein